MAMESDTVLKVPLDEGAASEYVMDDTLDPLQRLVRYHATDFSLQRLTLAKDVADTAESCGYAATVREILPLVPAFVQDQEPSVRLAFVSQIPPLARFLLRTGGGGAGSALTPVMTPAASASGDTPTAAAAAAAAAAGGSSSGYDEMLRHLLPAAVELLADKNVEVGFAALQVMGEVAQLLRRPHVEEQLLPITMSLANDNRAEDYRVVAAHLFNDLAAVFGPSLCLSSVLPQMTSLGKESNFCVRRAVASSLAKIAVVVGPEAADQAVLPVFIALSRDEVWSVRKACAEAIVGVSEALAASTRVAQLIPVFRQLSEDSSRWVRVAAFQHLGRFLHTLPPRDVTSVLLKTFTDMAFQSDTGEGELAEFCAQSFPAVLQTVGAERWREMSDAFSALIKDAQWKVRRTVAGSLHEFATVLGAEGTEKHLIAAFELFLRDIDDIKHAVITNADAFIKSLPPGAPRERMLTLMCTVPPESENWRLRDIIAQKLGPVVQLVAKPVAFDVAGDLCCHLLEDSVVDVRISSYYAAAALLVHLEGCEHHAEFLRSIVAFATKTNFQLRHNFIYVLQQVIELAAGTAGKSASLDRMLDSLATLSVDGVANVRFSLARVLATACVNYPALLAQPRVANAVKALQADKDGDVQTKIRSLLGRTAPVPVLPRAASYRD
jgi:serine/threonine-protein phosphatase 4 regulatory subunit 1